MIWKCSHFFMSPFIFMFFIFWECSLWNVRTLWVLLQLIRHIRSQWKTKGFNDSTLTITLGLLQQRWKHDYDESRINWLGNSNGSRFWLRKTSSAGQKINGVCMVMGISLMRLMRAMVVPRQLAISALVEEISTIASWSLLSIRHTRNERGRRENTSSTRVWHHWCLHQECIRCIIQSKALLY